METVRDICQQVHVAHYDMLGWLVETVRDICRQVHVAQYDM